MVRRIAEMAGSSQTEGRGIGRSESIEKGAQAPSRFCIHWTAGMAVKN